jgi:D-alanine-D-alanine ligase
MGGPSAEHDISLKSGKGVLTALLQRGWPVEPLVIPKDLSVDEAIVLTRQALATTEPDVVFIALHGPFGEDGTIQGICDELHLAYTGSDAQASRLGLDKVSSRLKFERAGLDVPRWRLLDADASETLDEWATQLGLPLVIKPPNQGSSIGVSIVSERSQFAAAVKEAARYHPQVLMESFITGREVTVGILDQQPLPVIEIHPVSHQFFDFTAKYTAGQTRYDVPASLDAAIAARVQAAGLAAHKAIGCRHFSRVDCMLTPEGQPVILEVNTIPGMTTTSLLPKAASCVGVSYEDLCERLVTLAIDPAKSAAWTPRP